MPRNRKKARSGSEGKQSSVMFRHVRPTCAVFEFTFVESFCGGIFDATLICWCCHVVVCCRMRWDVSSLGSSWKNTH